MSDKEVGAALMGHRGPIINREAEPWPGWMPRARPQEQTLPQSVHPDVVIEHILRTLGRLPEGPVRGLEADIGANDVRRLTDAEILQHLMMVDYLNSAPGRAETEGHAPWLSQVEMEKGLSPREVVSPPLPRPRPTQPPSRQAKGD